MGSRELVRKEKSKVVGESSSGVRPKTLDAEVRMVQIA